MFILRESFDYDNDHLVLCTNTCTLFVAPMVLMVYVYGVSTVNPALINGR